MLQYTIYVYIYDIHYDIYSLVEPIIVITVFKRNFFSIFSLLNFHPRRLDSVGSIIILLRRMDFA